MSLFKHSQVKEINASAFNDKKLKNELLGSSGAIVVFYASWCGHCQFLAPELKKFASVMGSCIKVYAIESVNEDLTKLFKIEAFPTIKFTKSGSLINANNFGREYADMVKFILTKTSECKIKK